jgi:hypothetical protein
MKGDKVDSNPDERLKGLKIGYDESTDWRNCKRELQLDMV